MKQIIVMISMVSLSFAAAGQVDSIAVSTPEGITIRMLELISGEIGVERDWDSYRMLFLPNAQKISVNYYAPIGRQIQVRSLEEFVRNIGPLYSRDGFDEQAIGVTVHEFNGVAQVFQSFECKNLLGTYEKRGVNCFQLVYGDGRWWIANVTFANETEAQPLPEKYIDK